MHLQSGAKVARRAKMGTVIRVINVSERPHGFEGDWPESQPPQLAIVHWPGRKKLAVELADKLVAVEEF